MKTHILVGNTGKRSEVISGLRLGDTVECIKDKEGLCDGGTFTVTFHGTLLTKGKIYTIDHLANWDGQSAPYVTNDDGALTWATTEHFKLPNS